MIAAKQLIEHNNRKRKELTPENEQYYLDFLIYIRLHLLLSVQQTEEILMEILDHLIEGQTDGKSAHIIFGNDPKGFADEIILQIPKEEKRSLLKFTFSSIILTLLSWYLMTRGIMIFIVSFFRDVDTEVNLLKSAILGTVIVGACLIFIWLLFKIIRDTLFKANKSNVTDAIKAGVTGIVCMGFIITIGYFLPDIGPSFHFTWYNSLICGAIVWVISRFLKN